MEKLQTCYRRNTDKNLVATDVQLQWNISLSKNGDFMKVYNNSFEVINDQLKNFAIHYITSTTKSRITLFNVTTKKMLETFVQLQKHESFSCSNLTDSVNISFRLDGSCFQCKLKQSSKKFSKV